MFCWDCILGWLSAATPGSQSCPIDKTPIKISTEEVKKKRVSYALTNIIADQIMVCKYRNLGCQETFSLSAFAVHLKDCKFKPNSESADSSFANLSVESTSGLASAASSSGSNQQVSATVSNSQTPTTSANPDPASTAASTAASTSKATASASTASKATTSSAAVTTKPKAKSNKLKKTLCKSSHLKTNDNIYFHPDWIHPDDKKLTKLTFKSIRLSYKPYKLASYIKVSSAISPAQQFV